jgi:DNA-binding protein, stimulates sugar fermentation
LILAPAPHCATVDHKDVANTGVLVGVHPQLGEQLAQSALSKGLLQDVIGYGPATLATQSPKRPSRQPVQSSSQQGSKEVVLYRQCTRGDSRVDFELVEYSSSTPATTTTSSSSRTTHHTTSTSTMEPITDPDPEAATLPHKCSLIEVKNVVCSDVKADLVPPAATTDNYNNNNKKKKRNINSNSRHACIIPSHTEPYARSAIFPWGRLGQTFEGTKVVSERAIKHLRNLANLSSPSQDKKDNVNDTAKNDYKNVNGIVLFVINRSDCQSMRACHEACPMFAKELKIASEKGCIVTSFRVHWKMDGKAYFDGIVPVTLSIIDS